MSEGRASAEVRGALAEAHRRQWAFVLAATVRLAGGLDLAEDASRAAAPPGPFMKGSRDGI